MAYFADAAFLHAFAAADTPFGDAFIIFAFHFDFMPLLLSLPLIAAAFSPADFIDAAGDFSRLLAVDFQPFSFAYFRFFDGLRRAAQRCERIGERRAFFAINFAAAAISPPCFSGHASHDAATLFFTPLSPAVSRHDAPRHYIRRPPFDATPARAAIFDFLQSFTLYSPMLLFASRRRCRRCRFFAARPLAFSLFDAFRFFAILRHA